MKLNWKPFLDVLPTPLYTVFYFALKFELWMTALFWYLIATNLFELPKELHSFMIVVVWTYLPFLSYFWYQATKDQDGLISHFRPVFYSPFIYPLVASILLWIVNSLFPGKASFEGLWVVCMIVGFSHLFWSALSSGRGIPLTPFPWHLSLHKGEAKILNKNDLYEWDRCFLIRYEVEHHKRDPWKRTWREELEQRPSQTHVATLLVMVILIGFLHFS